MKNSPIILALSLWLTACSCHDAAFKSQILGTWKVDGANSTMTFASDGTFTATSQYPGQPKRYTGTWRIGGGVIFVTHKEPGTTNACAKIIRLDEHHFIFKEDGETVTFKR